MVAMLYDLPYEYTCYVVCVMIRDTDSFRLSGNDRIDPHNACRSIPPVFS